MVHRSRPDAREEFERLQLDHFAQADEAKFRWQTANPYMAKTERELLQCVPVRPSDRLLEVGCGEGGNLELLPVRPKQSVGVDLSRAKVGWAARSVTHARFVCANATGLPFREGSFDVILCRDVLHHVVDKAAVVAEILRVCRSYGRIVIMEPNGVNPIMFLLGLLIPAERDLLGNTVRRLRPLLDSRHVAKPEISWAQPFPFGRVLFHYRWGCPRLSAWLARMVLFGERLVAGLIPSGQWAYLVLRGIKRGPES